MADAQNHSAFLLQPRTEDLSSEDVIISGAPENMDDAEPPSPPDLPDPPAAPRLHTSGQSDDLQRLKRTD